MKRKRSFGSWSLEEIVAPPGTPLLEHVIGLIPESGRGPIRDGGHPLPDEPPPDPSKTRWGGAFDGLAAVGRVAEDTDNTPLEAAAAVLDLTSTSPTQRQVDVALDRLNEVNGPHQMDRFLSALQAGRSYDRGCVATFARWICTTGTRRQVVKAGIAMLGVSGSPDDRETVMQLGLLELLTLYSLVALSNLLPTADAEEAIFQLAPQVEGWGRIHAILRLKKTDRPDIQAWMVRGGASIGSYLTEEIAYVAAMTGRLSTALTDEIDDDLFDGAGELLRALAVGGPAEDMTDYADGAVALRLYLARAREMEPTLARLNHLTTVERYLGKWAEENPHFPETVRLDLAAIVREVLDEGRWREFVESAFFSDDFAQVKSVSTKAPRYGIDPSPTLVAWLDREPLDAYLWQTIAANADGEDLVALVERAYDLLPLDQLASGPSTDLGTGREYAADSCLGVIVQRLRETPGIGWPLVRTALRNRVTSNRNGAVRTLAAWPRSEWPEDAEQALNAAMWIEPREKARQAMRDLLSATPDPT